MGGYGSGGYRYGKQRVTVEACVRVDARMLRSILAKEEASYWTYSSRDRETCKVIAFHRSNDAAIELSILRDGQSHSQTVRLSWQPCRFGGRRAWLHCPLCGRRVFRLYFYPHLYMGEQRIDRFYCRLCLPLTYELRRERDLYWWKSKKMGKLKKKLGGSEDYNSDIPYQKPKWMRWPTYARLMKQYERLIAESNAAFVIDMARKFPNIVKDVYGERALKDLRGEST